MKAIDRVRDSVVIVGGIATISAALATIFPDTFTIRGTPPLGPTLTTILAIALPLAVACAFIYLLILDRRLGRLRRDHEALAVKQDEIRAAGLRTPLYEMASRVMGSEGRQPAS